MIRKLHFLSFFSIFICICLMLSTLSFYFLQPKVELAVNTAEKAERVIVIDAGHGGIDSGASGPDGTLEKDLNLAVSKKLATLFKIAGYTVIETRTGDHSLASEDAQKGHVKQSDLENRLKISNEYENALFISIHMNSYRGVVCRGLQVWYSQNNEESLEMARAVQDGVKVQLQPENNRKIKSATSSIYLLRHAKNPSILIECGFISNEEECKKLSNEEYQRALCLAIFSSLHKKMSGSTCEK